MNHWKQQIESNLELKHHNKRWVSAGTILGDIGIPWVRALPEDIEMVHHTMTALGWTPESASLGPVDMPGWRRS